MLALLLARGLTSGVSLVVALAPPVLDAQVQVEEQVTLSVALAAPQLVAIVKTNVQAAVEDRLWVVAAEDRGWVVPNESRGLAVKVN